MLNIRYKKKERNKWSIKYALRHGEVYIKSVEESIESKMDRERKKSLFAKIMRRDSK